MNKRMLWSRILSIIGLAVMTIIPALLFGYALYGYNSLSSGVIVVLDLTSLILPVLGSGLAALGGFLGKSRYRRFMYGALALTACGLTAAILSFGPYFEPAGPVPWWVFVSFGYPIGVIMSCVGAVLVIVESFRRAPVSQDGVGTV